LILTLTRKPSSNGCTFGELSNENGDLICYTLERPEVQIPPGQYNIEMTWSPRFNRPLPLLDGTSPRTDIRIHSGNWPRDTEGCILVGLQLGSNMLCQSQAALGPLVTLIQQALDAHDVVMLSIV
jgi:Family of unknown function (DUF5675)